MDTFPRNILDEGDALAALLGTFWAGTFAGRAQVAAYCDGFGRLAAAAAAATEAALACLSVDTVPAFRTEDWHPLTLLRSAARAPAYRGYGAGAAYGDGGRYGDTAAVAYDVPSGVADVALVFDRVTTPAVSLVAGLDFLATPGAITFRSDPFADPRLATRPVVDAAGAVVDAEMTLWLYRPQVDRDDVFLHFGYALGLRLTSSPAAQALVVALWDALVLGASAATVDRVLATLSGVPVAAGAEVVAAVGRDRRGPLVITDRAAYRLPPGATATVAPGDVLGPGQSLCDAVSVHVFNRGTIPAGMDALAIGAGVLAPGYAGDLVFEGRDVPLEVAADGAGRTRVSFALGGFPADVAAFWDAVHAAGVARGRTLAHLLDARAYPAGEPTAASLPATVNPLAFLAANFLRSNCALVRVRLGSMPPGAPGLGPLRLLRRVIPPHTALFVLVDMPRLESGVAMVASAQPSPGLYTAPEPLGQGPPTLVDIPVPPKIRRTCQ